MTPPPGGARRRAAARAVAHPLTHAVTRTVAHACALTCASAALLLPTDCRAQATPPDAGSVQRDVERDAERERVLRPTPAPPQAAAPRTPPAPRAGAATVVVRTLRFSGNTAVGSDALNERLAAWRDRPLDFAGLQAITDAVAEAYAAAGWLASARLPRQDLTDGTLQIEITESRFGRVRFEGQPAAGSATAATAAPAATATGVAASAASAPRVPQATLDAMVRAAQTPGALLNLAAVERVLLLLDDLPGVAVAGALAPGAQPGETDIVLTVAGEPAAAARVAADNTGSRSVGAERLLGVVSLNSPLGIADAGQAVALLTRGSQYLRAAWGLPLGLDGTRAGAYGSALRYRVMSRELRALDAAGDAQTLGLTLSHPLLRARAHNLSATAQLERRRYDNRASGSTTSHYHVDALNLDLAGNRFDDWAGGGANSASVTLVLGRVALAGSPNAAADAQTARTAGGFRKLAASASRQQALDDNTSLFAAATAQRASRNLDSSEKLALGGAGSVRAYPTGEAAGSEGALLNLELRRRVAERWTLVGFYDLGRTRSYTTNSDAAGQPLTAQPNAYTLQGAGVSAGWQAASGLDLKAALARRIGSHPAPATSGADQDGSHRRWRLWLSAGLPL